MTLFFKCRRAIAIPPASASACKIIGQMLKSSNFSLSVFFFHFIFNFAYHTDKALHNKSSRQAASRDCGTSGFMTHSVSFKTKQKFYCLKGPRWHLVVGSSVCLFVRPSVYLKFRPAYNKVQYLRFGWWNSNQTWTVSSSIACSHCTYIPCPWGGAGSKCRTWRFLPYLYPPQRSLGGVYWNHPVRLSVRLSVDARG